MQEPFVQKNEAFYAHHRKCINEARSEEEKIGAYLDFMGLAPTPEDKEKFKKLSYTDQEKAINRSFRQKSLFFHSDRLAEGEKGLGGSLFQLLSSAKEVLNAFFLRKSNAEKPTYLKQAEKEQPYQYALDESFEFYGRKLDPYLYVNLPRLNNIPLNQWEEGVLVVYGDKKSVAATKKITVSGEKAFFLLLSSGAIHGITRFDRGHCYGAVESLSPTWQAEILSQSGSIYWLRPDDRESIAKKLIKKTTADDKTALINPYFNSALPISEVCQVAYRYPHWKLEKNDPESVFIYYYTYYPEQLRAADFLALKPFDTVRIYNHLKQHPENISRLTLESLVAIAKTINTQIIFDNPIAHMKLMESDYWHGDDYWNKFVGNLLSQVKCENEFERYCLTQFFLGELNGSFFSEPLKQKINDIIRQHQNPEDVYLPQWMIAFWLNAKTDSSEPETLEENKGILYARQELLKGNFSVLNSLSDTVFGRLLNDKACESVYTVIKTKQDNPAERVEDLNEAGKLQFLSDNLEALDNLLQEAITAYRNPENIPSPKALENIQAIYQQIKKIDTPYKKQVETLRQELLREYQENFSKLCAGDLLDLDQAEKDNIKKVSQLCDVLCENELDQLNRKIIDCIHSIFSYVIHKRNFIFTNSIYLEHQSDNTIFGICLDGNQKTLDVLEKLFDVSELLGTKTSYFKNLRTRLSDLSNQEVDEDALPDTDQFPKEQIKTIMLDALRSEFAVFVDGERKNATQTRWHNDKYKILPFEFLNWAYTNLEATNEYQQGLQEAYSQIKSGKVPLERYYVIRQHEKEITSPELEQAVMRKELTDAASINLSKKDTSIFGAIKNLLAPDTFQSNLLALSSSGSTSETVLRIEGSKTQDNSQKSMNDKAIVLVNASPLAHATQKDMATLAQVANQYDPNKPEHVNFVRDLKSPARSPVLSEQFKDVDETDKASVQQAVNQTATHYSQNVASLSVDTADKEIHLVKNQDIVALKNAQLAVVREIKYNLNQADKQRIEHILDRYTPDMVVPHPDDHRYVSNENLGTDLAKIIHDMLKYTTDDAVVEKIIHFLFIHYYSSRLHSFAFTTAFEALYDKEQKTIQHADLFLETLEASFHERFHRERLGFDVIVFAFDNEPDLFPKKLARMILFLAKAKPDINFADIQTAIKDDKLNLVKFIKKHKNSGLSEDELTAIFSTPGGRRTFEKLYELGRERYSFSHSQRRIPFEESDLRQLMQAAAKNPVIFNQFFNLLTNSDFQSRWIPAFCTYIESLDTAKEWIYLGWLDRFSFYALQSMKPEYFLLLLKNENLLELFDKNYEIFDFFVKNFIDNSYSDPLKFELCIILAAADVPLSEMESRVSILYPAINEMDFTEFALHLQKNYPSPVAPLLKVLWQFSSPLSLYLLGCFSENQLEHFSAQSRQALFDAMLKNVDHLDTHSKVDRGIAEFIAQTILTQGEVGNAANDELLDGLYDKFKLPILKTRAEYNAKNKPAPVLPEPVLEPASPIDVGAKEKRLESAMQEPIIIEIPETGPEAVKAITVKIIENQNEPEVVQQLILQAAEKGVLPLLYQLKTTIGAFEKIPVDSAKNQIAFTLLRGQKEWLKLEKTRQEEIAEEQKITQSIQAQREVLNQEAEQFKPYTMTMKYKEEWLYDKDKERLSLYVKQHLDSNVPSDRLPVLVKCDDDIWIYGKNHLGNNILKKSKNPHIYQEISFHNKWPKTSTEATEEINQEIRYLKIKHLEDKEKEWTSSILRIEAEKNKITQSQKQLVVAAAQHGLLPSKESVAQAADEFNQGNYGTIISESEQEGINNFIQNTVQQNHSESAIESPELTKIIYSLKEKSFYAFRNIVTGNICLILSKDSSDEDRKLLIENLQNAPFYESAYSQAHYIPNKNKIIDNVDFSYAEMSGANFERVSFSDSGATFSSAQLAGANFFHAGLAGVDFSYADMRGVNLCGAGLERVSFVDTDLSNVNFEYTDYSWGVDRTDVTAEQLLKAKDLRNIGISSQKLESYGAEDQIKLRNKLVENYNKFFAVSTDLAAILENARIISPSVRYSNFNPLGKLNDILEPNNQKNCEVLLDIAYQRMIAVIQSGTDVTEELVKKLDDPEIFGEEKTATLKQEISWCKNYREYMELLRPLEEGTSENTADQLKAVFDKMAILFEIDGFRAGAVFEHFNSVLAGIYGEDERSRLQTFLSLALSSPIKDNSQFRFYFAQALWFLKGNAGFSSPTEKWQLIISLLENSTHPEAKKLQTTVFRDLLAGSPQLGLNDQSLAQLVGVDYVVNYALLENIINDVDQKKESELATKFRGKTIAVYEQLVMAPAKRNLITIPAVGGVDFKLMDRSFKQRKYHDRLEQQTKKQLEQLDWFINEGLTVEIASTKDKEPILSGENQQVDQPILTEKVQEPSRGEQDQSGFQTVLKVALFLSVIALAILIGFGAGGPVGAAIGAVIGVVVLGGAVAVSVIRDRNNQENAPDIMDNPQIESEDEKTVPKNEHPAVTVSQNQVFPPPKPDSPASVDQAPTHSPDPKNPLDFK